MSVEVDGAGAPVQPNYCTRCGTRLTPGSNYCSKCGQPLGQPARPAPTTYYQPYQAPKAMTLRDLVMGVGTYASVALLVLLAINVVIAVWGIGLVYPHMDSRTSLYVITPFIVPLVSLTGGAFFLYYALLAAAIAASFVWMFVGSARPLRDELVAKYPSKGHSPLYTVGTIFMAVLAFNIIYYFAVQGAGNNPTSPSFDQQELWQIMYGFAQASVWEEVVSRVLLIGVPLLVVDGLLRSSSPGHKLRPLHRYVLGGGFSIGRKEAFFLAFSAAMFGTAHVFNWDLFKIVPAAVAGLAFGYLYLKVGLYASIMLHFAFDFLSVPLDVFPDSGLVTVVLGLALMAWIVVGVPYILLYASKGLGWLLGTRVWPDKPAPGPTATYGAAYGYYQYPPYNPPAPYQQAPSAPPAPYAPAPAPRPVATPRPEYGRRDPTAFGFTCRNCGHREALYRDGELVCTRCGAKN